MGLSKINDLSHPKYRPDIDGLRALAILSVLGFHAFPGLVPGGFIGVDIFFVISGYLISIIIFESLEQQHFSYIEFYSRRIKRIFPALLLVLFCSTIFAWFILFPDEYKSFANYVMAGSTFLTNLFAIRDTGNYFDAETNAKSLLHLWSLGVEEQFYILWPLLLGFVWRRHFNFLKLTFIIGIISFFFNLYLIRQHPIAAFYSPLSRFWELMIGGVGAYITLHKPHYLKGKKNWRSLLGLIFIILGLILLNKESVFPGYYALFPTLGTFLIISAGPNAWLNRRVFSHQVAIWFGLISYPLYLWHWPILSFVYIDSYGFYDRKTNFVIKVLALLIAIGLAYLTYHYIEAPIRKKKTNPRNLIIGLFTLLVTAFILGASIVYFEGIPSRIKSNEYAFYWPEKNEFSKQCLAEYKLNEQRNVWGVTMNYCLKSPEITSPLTMVIGDSHANALYYGLQRDLKSTALVGGQHCLPFQDLDSYSKANNALEYKEFCPEVIGKAYQNIGKNTLNVVLISRWDLFFKEGQGDENQDHILIQELKRDITALIKEGKHVFLVLQVPELNFSPKQCLNLRPIDQVLQKNLLSCKMQRSEVEKSQSKFRKMAYQLSQEINNKHFVILDPWVILCDSAYCYAKINNFILYRDLDHLNMDGADYLWRKMKAYYLKNKSMEMPEI